MFCTQCGTKIDEGKKFCRNCGAKTTREAEAVPPGPGAEPDPPLAAGAIETPTGSRPAPVYDPVTRPLPVAPAGAGRGINKLGVIAAAGIAVIVVGVGIYLGTDLLRQPVKEESASVKEPAANATETAAPPAIEEAKATSEAIDPTVTSTVQSPPSEPQSPSPVEAPELQPEVTPSTSPKSNTEMYTRNAPSPPTVKNPPASAPVARPPVPAVASRPPADPGTYQTIRATTVFAGPSASSRIVANVGSGIQVNVVGSNGDWLEVRSKHGKPPGFIRRDDAVLIERIN
ncbi:MAG: zinc-ribbon domain-containing protein [Candidatus Binatia bacterium]